MQYLKLNQTSLWYSSNNCLLDQGDVYDQAEYEEHARLLPGERYDLDAQCRLIQGKDSKLCEVSSLLLCVSKTH